jgi:hypothetical protein
MGKFDDTKSKSVNKMKKIGDKLLVYMSAEWIEADYSSSVLTSRTCTVCT